MAKRIIGIKIAASPNRIITRFLSAFHLCGSIKSSPEVGGDLLETFPNRNALWTLLLALPAFLALGRKPRTSAQHAPQDDVVIRAGDVFGIEHAALVIHFEALWDADVG
jgi:hypothetical protein